MNNYQREIEKLLQASERKVSKELQKMYKNLADEISKEIVALQKEIDETDKFSKKLQKERLEAIRNQMDRKIRIVEQDQKSSIWFFLRYNGDTAYNSLFYEFEMSKKIPLAFGMLTDKQLNVIINTPVASRKLSTRLSGNTAKMKKNLNRVLMGGFGKGLSTQKMARQLADIGGAEYRRAMNIARTEAGRVTGVTRQQSQNHAKELGVDVKKKWVSTLDGDTRTNHRELDEQVKEIDERFSVGGHSALQPHMFGIASEDCNCRCTTISVIEGYEPSLRRDNESHEEMDYQNYNDWLGSKGKESKVRSNDYFDKTNMKEMVGNKNYNDFLEGLDSIEDANFKELLENIGSQLNFTELSDGKNSVRGNKVKLSQEAFNGNKYKTPLQSVFHELGHAVDNLGVEALDSDFDRVSEMPGYKLKNDIKKDLLKLFNDDLGLTDGQKIKNPKKLSIFDQSAIVRKYKDLLEKNPKMYSALSDMMESTGAFIDHPLGFGHGKKYWNASGMQEAEFFAHMSETVANKEARKMMYDLFPTASKKWEKMVADILKKMK